MKALHRTHIGSRDENEDRLYASESLFAVVDGMGGHACGGEAAQVAVEGVARSEVQTASELVSLVCNLHKDVVRMGLREHCRNTAAVIVTALFQGTQIHICWAGDSRAYRLRDGTLTLLTRDHNLYEGYKMTMGEDRAKKLNPHLAAQIVVFLGGGDPDPIEPEIRSFDVKAGDRYLLCSDGVYGQMGEKEMTRCLSSDSPCENLETEALKKPMSDNVTSVVVFVE